MKYRLFVALAVVSIVACGAVAQEIKTVFMTTLRDGGPVLPILVPKGRTLDAEGNEVGSFTRGTRTSDTYTGLCRYDDGRLLLGVCNNGINEEDPDDNLALAAQFPDYSLFWINDYDGTPMGLALEIGRTPVEQSAEWQTELGYDTPYFYGFDVDDDGKIYVIFGAFLLRYVPDGASGFTGPETLFEFDVPTYGPKDENISTFGVKGSGANTQINFGNGTGYFLGTTDGDHFEVVQEYQKEGWPPIGGCTSEIIRGPEALDEWIYVSGYGNNSNGADSTFYRLFRPIDDPTVDWADDSEFFSAQGMPDAGDLEYGANYIGDVAGADGLPYVVAYSTPSWNTDIKTSPGFIGLHDVAQSAAGGQDGAYISHITIDVLTTDEIRLPDATTSSWYGTEGTLEVNVPEGAPADACEILWSGGIYGYGRFIVGDIPVGVGDWSLY